jgi:hypothetical protein
MEIWGRSVRNETRKLAIASCESGLFLLVRAQTRITSFMFPPRKAGGVLTTFLLLTCAALSAGPRNALGEATSSPAAPAASTATPTASPIPSPKLGNISTRAVVESGQNVLIAGFIITGMKEKKVLIRGLGPSLPVDGRLADPTLEVRDAIGDVVHDSKFYLLRNDDWKLKADGSSQQAEIEATGIPPTNDVESAILATLPARGASYTVVLKGYNQGSGIGVVEVYDLDPTSDSKLANISTRGVVSTGDKVMIAGTIVVGIKPQKVIIRGIGPSLCLEGKLRDPIIELVDANGAVIDENDNWEDSPNKQAIMDSGLQPSDPLESAIMAALPANNATYTVIVGGVMQHSEAGSPIVSRTHFGSGNTVEVQRVQLPSNRIGGSFQLIVRRPTSIVSGQPGDKAALDDSITIPWNATADNIRAAILASSNFYKYDQNNHLTAGPAAFHTLFDSGGGLAIAGNEGFRREPVVTGSVTDFTIQFGTLTTGSVGTRNTWITALPDVQVDDSAIIYGDTGVAVVEVYALQD